MVNYLLVTDGSVETSRERSKGGYAYRLSEIDNRGNRKLLYEGGGSEPLTTNNRMEMSAIRDGLIVAMDHFKHFDFTKEDNLIVISDSELCVMSLTKFIKTWLRKMKNGVLRKSDGKPVENQDVIKKAYGTLVPLREMVNVYIYHINSHINKNKADRLIAMERFMEKNNCLMSIELFNNIAEENEAVDKLAKQFVKKGE